MEHVERMTSAEQISEYLVQFRDNLWPDGSRAEPRAERDFNTRMRTRVVAKAKMLGTIDDELKSFLGSDTTRRGVLRVFNMFQHKTLNRRLVYVVVEGMLQTLFPEHKFKEMFQKIHSNSERVTKLKEKKQAASQCAQSRVRYRHS